MSGGKMLPQGVDGVSFWDLGAAHEQSSRRDRVLAFFCGAAVHLQALPPTFTCPPDNAPTQRHSPALPPTDIYLPT
eukprot:351819-Chlamydomonas_euryale.AAC.3